MEAESALATLYNNLPLRGKSFLSLFLIVFISAPLCAWKTGALLWIPGRNCWGCVFGFDGESGPAQWTA
jgi:hypothetical protein